MPGGGARTPPPGVVLDCDGVLVDSEPLHARATTLWAATIGVTLRPEYFHDLIGMTVFDQVARIVKGTGHDPDQGVPRTGGTLLGADRPAQNRWPAWWN